MRFPDPETASEGFTSIIRLQRFGGMTWAGQRYVTVDVSRTYQEQALKNGPCWWLSTAVGFRISLHLGLNLGDGASVVVWLRLS